MKWLLVMTVSIGVLSIVGCGSSPTEPPPSSDELLGTWIKSNGELELIFNPDETYIKRYVGMGGRYEGKWWLEGNKLTMTAYFLCISFDPISFGSSGCSRAPQGDGHLTWTISVFENRLNFIGSGLGTDEHGRRRAFTHFKGTWRRIAFGRTPSPPMQGSLSHRW